MMQTNMRVPMLTISNYSQWKMNIELCFTSLLLWDFIDIVRPNSIDNNRCKKEAIVIVDIRNAVDPSIKNILADICDPKKA